MRLYVIRHGKAERQSASGADRDRPLAERGLRQSRWLAAELARREPRVARIVSSPFDRARSTAEPIAGALGLDLDLDERLGVGEALSGVVSLIGSLMEWPAVAVVGHNPQLSDLVDLLVHGVGVGDADLRTGQAAVLELPDQVGPGCAMLVEVLRLDD